MGSYLPFKWLWPSCRNVSTAFLLAVLLICSAEDKALASDQNAVSLDTKIGQMLMLGFQGTNAAQSRPKILAEQIRRGQVGGVVMLGYNFKSKTAVKGLTSMFRKAAGKRKVFLAVDMEGGAVQRLGRKLGYPSIPSAWNVAQRMSPETAGKTYSKLAQISRTAGFNMNLAPVIDLRINPHNPVIARHRRSFSADPAKTVSYARAFVRAHHQYKVIPVLKHFPGHGSSSGDSHAGFVDITKSWKQKELEPFKQLIESGDAPAIMPGHLVHKRIASDGVPVSISKPAINGLLRGELKFQGLVVSDDLQMAAIAKNYKYRNAIIRAINAGVDMLMISNSRRPDKNLAPKTIAMIKKAIASGDISSATIDAAYRRIVAAKRNIF